MSDQQPDPGAAGLSGIQLQPEDLYGTPGYALRPADSPAPSPINPDGWLGLPDPELYAPNTEQLTSAQLKAERAKGNVLSLAELQKLPWRKRANWLEKQRLLVQRVQQRLPALSQAKAGTSAKHTFDTPYKLNMLEFLLSKPNPARPNDEPPLWKDPAAMLRVVTDWMQNHCWIRMGDGVVSLWNLFHFVERNPELRALVNRRITGFDTDASRVPTAQERGAQAVPWRQQGELSQLHLPSDMEAALPQGLLASGEVWQRRPSKWLWGLDGVRDLGYALYVHEDYAEMVMRGKWGGLPVARAMGDPEYWRDAVSSGADMGMTLVASAVRDLPLEEQCRVWSERVAATLRLYQPQDETAASSSSLRELVGILDPRHLAEETRLLTEDGSKLREGAKLLFNTDTDGNIIVQAISPGKLREQESYLLGAVQDRELCRALLGTFLDPDAGAEPQFAATAMNKLLFFVNGFRSGNRDDNPHQRLAGAPIDHFEEEVVPASANLFRLPRVGEAPYPTLVSTIADRSAFVALEQAVEAATEAARKVPSAAKDVEQRRRRAAEMVLSRSLVPLGVPEQLLQGAFLPKLPDVSAAAEPLQVSASG